MWSWSRPTRGLCWLEAHLLLCAAGWRGLGGERSSSPTTGARGSLGVRPAPSCRADRCWDQRRTYALETGTREKPQRHVSSGATLRGARTGPGVWCSESSGRLAGAAMLDPGAGSQEGHLHVTAESFPTPRCPASLGPGVREPPERRAGAGLAAGPCGAGWKRTTRLGFLCFRLSVLRPGLRQGSLKPQDRKEADGHSFGVCLGGPSATGRGWKAGSGCEKRLLRPGLRSPPWGP